MGIHTLKFLGFLLLCSLFFTPPALAQTHNAASLTKAEQSVCTSVKHCVDIMKRHGSDSFDYQVLGGEFVRLGQRGRLALINAIKDTDPKTANRAASLLNNKKFRFSPDDQRKIAAYWRQGYPKENATALAPVMLQLYSPLMRSAAISTLTHKETTRREASQTLITQGEKFLSAHSLDYAVSEFKADPNLFVPLSRGVMQDPTPSLVKFIGAYPAHKSTPILHRLFQSEKPEIVSAAYLALKSQDANASFQKLVKEIQGLKTTQTDRAMVIGTLVSQLNETRSDNFYFNFALQLMGDNALSSSGQIVGLDALLKQNFDLKNKDKITPLPEIKADTIDWRPLINQVLNQSEKIPPLYFNDLDIKLGSEFDDTAPLFWNKIKTSSSHHKLAFLDNFQSRPVSPKLLSILNEALNDVTDWDVSAFAAEILGRGKALSTAPKLRFLAENHPIFAVQVNVKAALDSLGGGDFQKRKLYWAQALSAKTQHCDVKAYSFRREARQLPFFDPAKMAFGYTTNRLALTSALATDTGWLAGYDFGEYSGGLLAYDNVTGEGQLIYGPQNFHLEGEEDYDIPNVLAIAPKTPTPLGQTANAFWVITGQGNTAEPDSYILSVTKIGPQFDIRKHAKLSSAPSSIQKNNDGSLTLGFGKKPNLARIQKYKSDRAKLADLLAYNPPLRLFPSGNITRHCKNKTPSNLEAMH